MRDELGYGTLCIKIGTRCFDFKKRRDQGGSIYYVVARQISGELLLIDGK